VSRRLIGLAILAAIGSAPIAAQKQDWPQWRGAGRDGAATFTVPASWPEKLTLKWKVEVGTGYSAPITAGNRVYAFARQGEDEVMRALDAATGKTVWETKYNATYKPNAAATRTHGTGPKSTPTLAEGRLFTLGMTGAVTAFDAATGKQLWQKPGGPVEPLYHTAMSPLVDRGLVIVHVGGHNNGALTAFDARTGDVRWSWTGDGPAYGSPIAADLGGTRQIVTLTQDNLIGVSAATGELLWRRPYTVRATRNAVTPIIHGQTIIISGLGVPVRGFRVINRGAGAPDARTVRVGVADEWSFEDVWANDDVSMDMSTGVLIGSAVYGFSPRNSGQFFALDANTGQTLWLSEPRQGDNAAVVRAGNLWFALETDAELVVARANPKQHDILKRYTVADSATWAQPVLSGNRIFVKDVSNISLWTLE
jgi:outer membrane protein assembly factor BamB